MKPPVLAQRLLLSFLRKELAEEVLGDLDEQFGQSLKTKSAFTTKWIYWKQTISYVRPFAIRKGGSIPVNQYDMLKNYLLVGVRSMLRNKAFSLINISGLAIGIACCVLLALFIQDEQEYEKHFNDSERIYRLTTTLKSLNGNETRLQRASPIIGPTMQTEFAELEAVTRVVKDLSATEQIVMHSDRSFSEKRAYQVDANFFDVFPYPFLEGDRQTALKEPWSVVLSEELAYKLFGTKPALNELLTIPTYSDTAVLRVTGVIKRTSFKSHLDADFYFSGLEQALQPITTWASGNFTFTYLKLKPGANAIALEAKFPAFMQKHGDEENKAMGRQKILGLQPLYDVHLHSSHLDNQFELGTRGSITYVYLAAAIGALILLLAAINFINLTTAKASQRAREIGIRKTVGAHRANLVAQFMGESIGIAVLAMGLAMGLIYVSLPYFNQLIQNNLSINSDNIGFFIMSLLAITLTTGFVAGIYPALVISSFQAIRVLKNKHLQLGSSQYLRKGLIAFQFAISVMLVSGILVVQHQLHYMQNKPLGFDAGNKIMIPLRTKEAADQYVRLRDKIETIAGVEGVTASSNSPSTPPVSDWSFYPEGKSESDAVNHYIVSIDDHYFNLLAVQRVAGRDFVFPDDGQPTVNVPQKAIVNETSLKKMGIDFQQAIGSRIRFANSNSVYEIVGVVEDFHQFSLHQSISPMLFLASNDSFFKQMIVAVNKKNENDTLAKITAEWRQLVPDTPFESVPMSESINKQYEKDRHLSALVLGSTLLAILISCLGLYGLSVFLAERRVKEIGIRKVMGASVQQILMLLTREYLKTLMVAIAIGLPLSYFVMQQWLQNFAYKDNPGVWLFALAAGLCLTVSLATVFFESLKAAWADPVKSIKTE